LERDIFPASKLDGGIAIVGGSEESSLEDVHRMVWSRHGPWCVCCCAVVWWFVWLRTVGQGVTNVTTLTYPLHV
jgi:hypothetical protein